MARRRNSRVRRRTSTLLALVLACSVLGGPAGAQEDHDPTEPERPASSFAAYPGSSTSLDAVPHQALAVDRVAGASRELTAVEAARLGWPNTAAAVVIASGDDFRDAMSAASLAGVHGSPLLLSGRRGLAAETLAEVERLQPQRIFLVGTVAPQVTDQLVDVSDVEPETIDAGGNVHETSAAVARRVVDDGGDTRVALVASALDFPDALAATALASGLAHPLLLAGPEGFESWLPARADELGVDEVVVLGGPAALPDDQLAGLQVPVRRLAGADRIGTALAAASYARERGLGGTPVVTSSSTFADALAGGVLAGVVHRAPLLLTEPQELHQDVARWLAADQTPAARLVGGTAALDEMVRCQLGYGSSRAWICVEQEMERQGYHVGPVDGVVDAQTVWMTYALQAVANLPQSGDFGEREWAAMLQRIEVTPRRPDLEPDRMEIDLTRGLVLVVRDHEVIHQLHTSNGKPSTPTVRGVFRVYEKRNYRQTRNNMYRPVFFHRGYAFHGYPSVPTYPASAGCARMYDGDMDFLWDFLPMGHQIVTYL